MLKTKQHNKKYISVKKLKTWPFSHDSDVTRFTNLFFLYFQIVLLKTPYFACFDNGVGHFQHIQFHLTTCFHDIFNSTLKYFIIPFRCSISFWQHANWRRKNKNAGLRGFKIQKCLWLYIENLEEWRTSCFLQRYCT